MAFLHPLLLLGALLATTTTTSAKPLFKPRSQAVIQWRPCVFPSLNTKPIECGSLSVPLDYTNPFSNETVTLALIKSPARNPTSAENNKKKSILLNFGGPGYEAVQSLNFIADKLHNMTGGQHDLIAFDPRGVASSALPFTCFSTPVDRTLANAKYPFLPGNSTEEDLVTTFANANAISNLCAEKHDAAKNSTNRSPVPTLIGTGSVARDLMAVVDALGEDGLLRFWGLSYGSVLGATAASLFPQRIDRMVLDGVVNVPNYYRRAGLDVDQFLSADAAFRAILSQCIASGPARCALASVNATAAELETTLIDLAESFRLRPLVTANPVGIITKRFMIELYFILIKYPQGISEAFALLHNLLRDRNESPEKLVTFYNDLVTGITPADDDALLGILCGDKLVPAPETVEDIRREVEAMTESSKLFGGYLSTVATQCAGWKYKAKGGYEGMFDGIKTRQAVLFVGNTYDPVTPAVSARNMSSGFEGSVVLERNGFGHSSLAQDSECTTTVLRGYFVNGTLPEKGAVCEVDETLF